MGRFAKNLDRRLRRPALADDCPDGFAIVVPPHPMKYPKHAGSKGSVIGGYCNTTRCENTGARFFNRSTYGYYCRACAAGIDEFQGPMGPLCVEVFHNLTREEMETI